MGFSSIVINPQRLFLYTITDKDVAVTQWCLVPHDGCKIQIPAVLGRVLLSIAVGFDENGFRCTTA